MYVWIGLPTIQRGMLESLTRTEHSIEASIAPRVCHTCYPHRYDCPSCACLDINVEFVLAWKVDFNLTVRSFEKQLQGLRNIVDMSLTSHMDPAPRVLFTSSAGIIRRTYVLGLLRNRSLSMPYRNTDTWIPHGGTYSRPRCRHRYRIHRS